MQLLWSVGSGVPFIPIPYNREPTEGVISGAIEIKVLESYNTTVTIVCLATTEGVFRIINQSKEAFLSVQGKQKMFN